MDYRTLKDKGYRVKTLIGTPQEIFPQIVGKMLGVRPKNFGFEYTKTVLSYSEEEYEMVLHEYLNISTEKNPTGWFSTHTVGKKCVSLYHIIEKAT